MIRCVRLWTGDDGQSHFEQGWIDLPAGNRGDAVSAVAAAVSISFRETHKGGSFDWHDAPARQLVLTLSGVLEFETRGGGRFTLGAGDILLAEDTTGGGHRWQTSTHQFAMLQQFFPHARRQDWMEAVAGQRVQIIKPDPGEGGILEFGTELVTAEDRSLVALLGASPGGFDRGLHRARSDREMLFRRIDRAGMAAETAIGHPELWNRSQTGCGNMPPGSRRHSGCSEDRRYLNRSALQVRSALSFLEN
jgi:quercetin dioxygenase-like cupin family protein